MSLKQIWNATRKPIFFFSKKKFLNEQPIIRCFWQEMSLTIFKKDIGSIHLIWFQNLRNCFLELKADFNFCYCYRFEKPYFVLFEIFVKVENILKGSLDAIPSPSTSVTIQIMGGKVCLRCKGKTLLGIINKLLKTKSLLTSPSNVLP